MNEDNKKTTIVLSAVVVISYMVYSILWMRVAFLYANISDTLVLAEQTAKYSTIRNICELCSYAAFFICCWNAWEDHKDNKYRNFLIQMGKVLGILLAAGIVLTLLQYIVTEILWSNYLTPMIIFVGIMGAVLFLVSGMQAKKDKYK